MGPPREGGLPHAESESSWGREPWENTGIVPTSRGQSRIVEDAGRIERLITNARSFGKKLTIK